MILNLWHLFLQRCHAHSYILNMTSINQPAHNKKEGHQPSLRPMRCLSSFSRNLQCNILGSNFCTGVGHFRGRVKVVCLNLCSSKFIPRIPVSS